MAEPTRYERLQDRLKNDFSRAQTLTPALSAGEAKTLINLDDHRNSYALTERFQKFGPFNALYVQNFSSYDVRVYLNQERTVFVDIPASSNQSIPVLERIPFRYDRFLRVENLNTSNAIAEGDIQIQVGNEVDGIELDLLEMAGELDV